MKMDSINNSRRPTAGDRVSGATGPVRPEAAG